MNYQKDFARGIKNASLLDSILNGSIKKFLLAVQADERFVIHIRNDYFNVYYKSGNVAKIGSNLKPEIDSNYFTYSNFTKKELIELFEKNKFEDYLNKMVNTMDAYWTNSSSKPITEDEGDVQQKISINNKNHISDFDVLDLEYQISPDFNNPLRYDGESPYSKSKPKSSPRFDIIAINAGKLYVIELKKGTSALRGTSGMHDHIDSYIHTIAKNNETISLFVEEMKNLLKQKQDFGLIDKSLEITSNDVEFCFAYSYKQPMEKRKREINSINTLLNSTDKNGIKPGDYKILYLEPGEYKLKL